MNLHTYKHNCNEIKNVHNVYINTCNENTSIDNVQIAGYLERGNTS